MIVISANHYFDKTRQNEPNGATIVGVKNLKK